MATPSVHKIPQQIELALKKAADKTGVEFQYLVDTAARESGFRARVKAKTSSATGLFQFIESTWLQTVKDKGPELGLGNYAKHIKKSSNGAYVVDSREKRAEILNLRKDPEIASLMAGAFTKANAQELNSRVGRKPTAGELYIAHFLGAANGAKLIKAASLQPNMKADTLFPKAANANKPLFYRSGEAVSVKSLYQNLVRRHHAKSVVIADPLAKIGQAQKAQDTKGDVKPLGLEKASLDHQGFETVATFAKDQLRGTLTESQKSDNDATSNNNTLNGSVGVWQVFGEVLAQNERKPGSLFSDVEQGRPAKKGAIMETMQGVRGLFRRGGLG